jgi:squalene-associated FAD-dependent desaturase
MRVAVVGAGWAGCAAALQAAERGAEVVLLEAARQAGGRARTLSVQHGGERFELDNGQHLLIGAYSHSLALMRGLGVDPEQHLLRMPLSLMFADGQGLCLPNWPPPLWAGAPASLAVALGVLGARGWSLGDKLSLLRRAQRWQGAGFACEASTTVEQLCAGLSPTVVDGLIAPLCISALNTPLQRASGAIFLRVMQDALFVGAGGSDLLVPTTDLSRLLPDAALRQLQQRGHTVHLGARALALQPQGRRWQLRISQDAQERSEVFDAVLLACPAGEAARLVCDLPAAQAWQDMAQALQHEAIATVYARSPGARLPRPMLALREGANAPAQFVFDRGALGGPAGLLAFVVSASTHSRQALEDGVQVQAQTQLGLQTLEIVQTVIERRATFACTAAVQRPGQQVLPGCASLLACADYVAGPYPATLEGAVRSGQAAADALA